MHVVGHGLRVKRRVRQEIPVAAWIAWGVLAAVGAPWGLLVGAGEMEPTGCILFVCAAVVGLVLWGVSLLDPEDLVVLDSYRGRDNDGSTDGAGSGDDAHEE